MMESLLASLEQSKDHEVLKEALRNSLQPVIVTAFRDAFENAIIPAFQVLPFRYTH